MVIQMNLFTKQKQTHRLMNELMVTRKKGGGRDNQGVWVLHVQIAIYKMDKQQGAIAQHRKNSAQYYVIT